VEAVYARELTPGADVGFSALIVDDSSTIRLIVRRCLEQGDLGIVEVWEAGNGEEALDVLAKQAVDVVLADINMPKMDGFQLLTAIKQDERWKDVPVLMITTEAAASAVLDAVQKGAAGYIRKPFTPVQIRSQISPLLKAAAAEKAAVSS
jgi:two-component system chemotaxis response regulator CheY